MKRIKRFAWVLVVVMCLSSVAPSWVPVFGAVSVQAAVKLNETKKTLKVGETFTLKVTGTSKTVTWSSSNKNIAKVTKKGKVTAKKAGTATITAKVGGKSYTCKITVTESDNGLTNNEKAALGIVLLKYTLLNPDSINIKKIYSAKRDFSGDVLQVYFVDYTAQNKAGGYSSGLCQLTIRNGKPSDKASGKYQWQDFSNCLTYPDLAGQFIECYDWSSPLPNDLIDKESLKVSEVKKLVELFEEEEKYSITD